MPEETSNYLKAMTYMLCVGVGVGVFLCVCTLEWRCSSRSIRHSVYRLGEWVGCDNFGRWRTGEREVQIGIVCKEEKKVDGHEHVKTPI